MRVGVFTQHYAPEVTAARYRVEAFVERFVAHGHQVDVICPVPNHPEGVIPAEYRGRLLTTRELGGADVRYLWVRTSPSKRARSRLAYYGTYAAMGVAAGVLGPKPDVIFASSPPLSVAAAAETVATLRRVPWIFDVRDLWPQAAELIGEVTDRRVLDLAERLERRLYRRADRIVAVTQPFVDAIEAKGAAPEKLTLIPNGTTRAWIAVGEQEIDRTELGLPGDRFVWTYAGNLGPSRRLDLAIDVAEQLGDDFQLVLIGDGGSRAALERQAAGTSAGRVVILGLMESELAARYLRASDALFVPQQASLGDFVPSKLYDCGAVGRPQIVAADGETERLARSAGIGICVPPADGEGLIAAVRRLRDEPELAAEMGARGREFARDYLRERQGDRLVELAEQLAGTRG